MSQSAENQSAMIENENNFNIDMESQAAVLSNVDEVDVEDVVSAGIGSVTPEQNQRETSRDMERAVAGGPEGENQSVISGINDEQILYGGSGDSVTLLGRNSEDVTNLSQLTDTFKIPHDVVKSKNVPVKDKERSAGTVKAQEPEAEHSESKVEAEEDIDFGKLDCEDIAEENNISVSKDQSFGENLESTYGQEAAECGNEENEAFDQELNVSGLPKIEPVITEVNENRSTEDNKQSWHSEVETEIEPVSKGRTKKDEDVLGSEDEDDGCMMEKKIKTPQSEDDPEAERIIVQSEILADTTEISESQCHGMFEYKTQPGQSVETNDMPVVTHGDNGNEPVDVLPDNSEEQPDFLEGVSTILTNDVPCVDSTSEMGTNVCAVDEETNDAADMQTDAHEIEDNPGMIEGENTGTGDCLTNSHDITGTTQDDREEVDDNIGKVCLEVEDVFRVVKGESTAAGDSQSAEITDSTPDDKIKASDYTENSSAFNDSAQEIVLKSQNDLQGEEQVESMVHVSEDIVQPAVQTEVKAILTSASNTQEANLDEQQTDSGVLVVTDKEKDVSVNEETSRESIQVEGEIIEDRDNSKKEVTEKRMAETSASFLKCLDYSSSGDIEKFDAEDSAQALDPEVDRASDATIEEGRDVDMEPVIQVTDVTYGADAERQTIENQDSMDNFICDTKTSDGTKVLPDAMNAEPDSEKTDTVLAGVTAEGSSTSKPTHEEDDDDVVVLDDEDEMVSQVKQEIVDKEVLNSNNDMGIQIESVSGGANEVHGAADQIPVKQENISERKSVSAASRASQGPNPPVKKSKTQTCIVCKKVGKCKYNIVRNGDIKHLCDDTCFKRFRSNPTMFLKGPGTASNATAVPEKKPKPSKSAASSPGSQVSGKSSMPGYKTCTVCLLMNINTQGQFCMWKGFDFCGEGCLGKFQSGIGSSCALCTAFIPLAARSTHCLRLGNEVRPFCSNRCYADYKLRLRLCTFCQKDAATVPDTFFSAPVGSDGSFKDFCSQSCMKKFEDVLSTDVEILRVETGKSRGVNKCSVCQAKELTKHAVKYSGAIHNLCSDACLSAFQYSNKLNMKSCDFCNKLCTSRESTLHTVQFEGHQKQFCSDHCVTKFRFNNRKVSPCSWCGTQRDNFDMIERLDSNNKYQLFCSLNCLSLYRVNLQAKSNQAVTCDQCSKFAPAQYHLTMSDASVRNFCSYNCVMTFQAQFSKGAPPSTATPPPPPPKHKHNTRGKTGRGRQQVSTALSSVPIISNVISLAPPGGQKNSKNNTGPPMIVSNASPSIKTGGTSSQLPVQQQIIIQPPPPKPMKNKSVVCKPFVQTKATSCRPHTQNKDCQTEEMKKKPVLIPVPVPVYLPTPMALYSAPAPTPVFMPIPIPVPVFIPTTRKSANGILKQIKEIREKTPSDPLEAELLMMAAAVSADGKHSSDSDSDEDMLPEINRSRKRSLAAEDEDETEVMPLTSSKEEEGGEEDMISMALRMAEEMSGPMTDLESAVEAVPVNTEPPPQPARSATPDVVPQEEELIRNRRGGKRGVSSRRGAGRPPKRPRIQVPQPEPAVVHPEPAAPPPPPADANYHLKFTYGVNAWRHWVLFKNNQIEQTVKAGSGRMKLFKTDILQCTADELNFSLCLFVKEVRKPNGDEYSPDSIYYLTLGIQQYLFENGRIDNIFTDLYYEKFTECLTQILSKCQPKFNSSGQMVCRIEEEHLWECKQLGAHSPYVLLNTLIYFHTKYFMLKTPEDHMKLSFAHILKYWKKGQPGKGGQPARSVSLRYYSVSTAKKDGSAPTSATKKGSKDGIPVYEVTENQDNPLRCPVKLYEFYLSKCPESIKNRSDIFYPVPERSCVPDSPVWYSTMPISLEVMTKMLTRILLVREIQEAHLHAQPIYV